MDQLRHAPDDPLWASVYQELRTLAGRHLGAERRNHTLQATALIHEVWLRLRRDPAPPADRPAFLRAAAAAMRRILVEHARSRTRRKRWPEGGMRMELHDDLAAAPMPPALVMELDELLRELAARSPRRAEVVQLRFFGGLSETETAAALAVSRRTVQYDFRSARAWLLARLSASDRAS